MLRLTARCHNVTVMTVSTLRDYLESVSGAGRKFSVARVRGDRVSIRCDYTQAGKKKHASVWLPAYPTGWPDDVSCNNLNVVLDPLEFEGASSCGEQAQFAAVFGEEVLAHYEKTHPASTLPISRCC